MENFETRVDLLEWTLLDVYYLFNMLSPHHSRLFFQFPSSFPRVSWKVQLGWNDKKYIIFKHTDFVKRLDLSQAKIFCLTIVF